MENRKIAAAFYDFVTLKKGMTPEAYTTRWYERELARHTDWVIAHEEPYRYFDFKPACSRKKERPGLERLAADAAGGMFDVVVVRRIDVFGKKRYEIVSAVRMLVECGVTVYFVHEKLTVDLEVINQMILVFEAYMMEKKHKKVSKKKRKSKKNGR